jgi:Fe-S-cluster containining protein
MECYRCTNCCTSTTVSLNDEDINRISQKCSSSFFRTRNTGVRILNWKEINGRRICIFLNLELKECMIYDDRPEVCKQYSCNT